jgi:4-amino-4-deoxy-L-arabinose transferase-like glycosyltransferase
VLNGSDLHEVPGAYFSGAPYLYPVLAALADHYGGLPAARAVSLLFALVATTGVAGLTARLYGRRAAVLAAAAFALSGPVIYVSHLAVYDSMMMALVALAAWLAVADVQRNGFRWAVGVAALLTLAGFVKYAGLVYAPMVALLAVAVGWPRLRWLAVRRAVFVLFATATIFFFIVAWDGDLIAGIRSTTIDRTVIVPASRVELALQIGRWVGPWLLLALLAAVLRRRHWFVSAVLLLASVIGPLQQLRLGEQVSLSKHCAFGLVFAAPLAGWLLAALFGRAGRKAALPAGLVLLILLEFGLSSSRLFLTGWVDDRDLLPVLTRAVERHPDAAILGERPSPQRYVLRTRTRSRQWNDTYYFAYSDVVGRPAYAKALRERHFGVIYLDVSTDYGAFVHQYLLSHRGLYRMTAKAPRWFRGKRAGDWLVYEPTPLRPSESGPLASHDLPG